MPINITYGGGAGNDILQAAHDLAAQNMQRYSQNLQYAHNLSSSFLGGMEMGQKGVERRDTAEANANKATALAAQNQAELALKQKQLQIDATKAGPAAMKAIGMQVPGELPNYAEPGPPEIQPPPGVNLPTTLQPEVPKIAPPQPSVGGLPGQYISAGAANQDQQQPASTHEGAMNVMENTISDIEGAAANTKLSAAGQQKYNAWASDIRAIQKQKNDYRPEQYNQVLSQALDKFRGTLGGTKWKNYTIPEPTPSEIFAKTVHTDENGNMFSITKDQHGNPKVENLGSSVLPPEDHFAKNVIKKDGIWWSKDPKGKWTPYELGKDEEKDSYDSEKSLAHNFSKNYDKYYEAAEAAIVREHGTDEDGKKYVPTPEEIHKRMHERFSNKVQTILGFSHANDLAAKQIANGTHPNLNGGAAALAGSPLAVRGNASGIGGFQPNVSPPAPVTPQAQLDQIHGQATGQPPAQQPPVPAVSPALAQAAINSLPKVNTKAEYDKLTKGSKFLDPDGNIRVKP